MLEGDGSARETAGSGAQAAEAAARECSGPRLLVVPYYSEVKPGASSAATAREETHFNDR